MNSTKTIVGTLTYLLRTVGGVDEICLAWKEPTANAIKRGLADKWNTYGGAHESTDTSIEAGAARELREESGVVVSPQDLVKVAEVLYVNSWGNFLCHDFVTSKFSGDPRATKEMSKPTWFPTSALPKPMMNSDVYTLPEILKGKKFKATVVHDENMKVVDFKIEYVEKF